ncbi:MAG: glycosyltransferase family 39 protein [Nanoarchaeota archaeon]
MIKVNIQKNYRAYLILLIILSLFFHLVYLDYSRFEHEMARDIIIAEKILNGNLVFHGLIGSLEKDNSVGEDAVQQSFGPLYYYLIAFSLIFASGHYYYPLMPYVLAVVIHLLSVLVLFKLCREFFNIKTALIASSLYTFSPWVFVHVGGMFTNSAFPVLLVTFFIYSMFRFLIKDDNKYLIFGMVSLALATQLHLSTLTLLPAFICYLFLKKKFKLKYFFAGLALSFLLFLPFLYYNITNNSIGSIFTFLSQRYEASFFRTVIESVGMPILYTTPYFGKYLLGDVKFSMAVNALVYILAAFMVVLFSLAIFSLLKALFRSKDIRFKILLIWIVVPILLYIMSSKDLSPHYLNILLPSQFIVLGIYLNKISKSFKLLEYLPYILVLTNLIFIILFFNLVNENNGTSGIFGVPYEIKYELMNFIKDDSKGADLIVNYYKGIIGKRDLNFLFNKAGLNPKINIINDLEEYKDGYLILDRFSYYSNDKGIREEWIIDFPLIKRIGKYEIFKK